MPTYKPLMKSKAVMGAALALNDLVSFDRNRAADPQKHLPRGQVISRNECLELMPGIADKSLTGGAVWHDAQMYNSERVTLSFVKSAAGAGADVANYVEAVSFLRDDIRITGIQARDLLTGESLEIRADVVVNTAGPWVEQVLTLLGEPGHAPRFRPSLAMNLVTRQIAPKYAIAIPSRYSFDQGKATPLKKSRILFVAPWRDYSIIGTAHLPYDGSVDDGGVTKTLVGNFLDEINAAYPGADLKPHDIYHIHRGFLPAEQNGNVNKVKLVREGQIYDYWQEAGIKGLVTVVGVKYTTARKVAEQATDLIFQKLGQSVPPCQTHLTPLDGGQIDSFTDYLTWEERRQLKGLDSEVIRHLVYNYGSSYPNVLACLDEDPKWGVKVCDASQVLKGEVLHSVRQEMAQKLADVIMRRTELGSAGRPSETCLRVCADIMAAELDWVQTRTDQEIEEVKAIYAN
jgi:glycerol-3-phosphate dehydrogenase